MNYLLFCAGNISPCSFTFGWAFHHSPKVLFSWFARVIAQVQAIARTSCQGLNVYQFWNAQSQQYDQFENLYITSHGEARNIKFGEQVNLIQKVLLGTPPQEVVTPLPHNHVINLFISSYKGANGIKVLE